MRLFVALSLPDLLLDQLTALERGLPGARWLPEDNLHLTLRFIGEVDGGLARDIDEALSAIRMPAFALTLEGVGQFGDGRKNGALWAGVAANPELGRLRDKVDQALIRAGLTPERRKFKPHVTLARLNGNPGSKLQEYLTDHALFRSDTVTVESFTLYSSFLSASGAIYRAEADYELERQPGAGW
jgi:2'-5' RNA ligase